MQASSDSLAERQLEGFQPGAAIHSAAASPPAQLWDLTRPRLAALAIPQQLCWSCPKGSFHLLLVKCPGPVTAGRQTPPSIWAGQASCMAASGLQLAGCGERAPQAGGLSYKARHSGETWRKEDRSELAQTTHHVKRGRVFLAGEQIVTSKHVSTSVASHYSAKQLSALHTPHPWLVYFTIFPHFTRRSFTR